MSEQFCHNCGLICMGQKGMPHTRPYGSCDSWKSAKQTNADRIRAMTDEELLFFLWLFADGSGKTKDQWRDWLKQEAKE